MGLLILLLLPLTLFLPLLLINSRKKTPINLPPGPRPWPAVGNIPQLLLLRDHHGKNLQLHAALASLAVAHGPLLYLCLGSRRLVVASTPAAAAEVLRVHDRLLSGRHVPATYRIPSYSDHSLVWSQSHELWRSLRAICKADLLSSRPLQRSATVRETKVAEMMDSLVRGEGEGVKIGDLVFRTVFNIFANMLFSRDLLFDGEGHGDGRGWCWDVKGVMSRCLELGLVANVEDFFPAVFGGLDLQGLRREVGKLLKMFFGLWGEIIEERKTEMNDDSGRGWGQQKDDFLKVLLSAGYGDLQLKALFQDLFTAGTDTTTASIEWTLSEIVRNPEVMKKVKDELKQVIGKNKNNDIIIVKESQLVHLTYLHACLKESLRLHPPAPLLLPHLAVDDACGVMNDYTIPKDSTVMVNVWAIGRDPNVWTDPLTFSPERFVDSSVDYTGIDFQFIPFGAGRRMCPGSHMAVGMVQLLLASMLHNFDWSLPDGVEPRELDMEERLGFVLERKHPLVLVSNFITSNN